MLSLAFVKLQRGAQSVSTANAGERYLVARDGEVAGPVPAEQVLAWVADGMRDAHIKPESGGEWLLIQQTPFWQASNAALTTAKTRKRRGGFAAFLLACLHAIRLLMATGLATLLAIGLATVVLVAAPINVMDSRDFWLRWAEHSPELQAARAGTDAALDGLARELQEDEVFAAFGDPGAVAGALQSARPKVHELMSGRVIDATLGLLSGRDERLQRDLGFEGLRRNIGQQIAGSFASMHCRSDLGSQAGCMLGRATLQSGLYEQAWNAASARLDKYDVFSGRFLGTVVPAIGTSRLIFTLIRGFIEVAWVALFVVSLAVVLVSFRLRTVSSMLAYAALLAATIIYWTGHGANLLGRFVGVSDWTWNLALESSGLMRGGFTLDAYLVIASALLLAARAFGPGWRRRFWERRLASSAPGAAQLARKRLSAPAGLFEPIHLLSAPK
jgi:hypothetical protein